MKSALQVLAAVRSCRNVDLPGEIRPADTSCGCPPLLATSRNETCVVGTNKQRHYNK